MSRAPGQWWARWRSTMRPWSPVLVREWHSVTDHEFERGCRMIEWQGVEKASRADDPDIEWGPYLGKEPSVRVAKADFRDARGGARVQASEPGKYEHPGGALSLTIEDLPYRPTAEAAPPEPVDPWPRRNSDENRKLYGAPDGWDLVWWKCIKVGDVVRYREGPHFSGDRERVHEGTVELIDALGPTIRIAGITGFNPTVNPSGWLRRAEETPTP